MARRLLVALCLIAVLLIGDRSGAAQATTLTFVGGTIVSSTVTLTFSETLDAASIPSTSAFQVRLRGSSRNQRVSNVAISGSDVSFEINGFVQRGDAATIQYCASGSNCGGAIRSMDGARTFTSYGALTPITTPGTPPEVAGVSIGTYTITIDFDKTLDSTIVPDGSAFTVNGFTTTVREVVISGMKATLHVLPPMPPWTHSYDPGLSYTPPSSNGLRTPAPAVLVAAFTRSSIGVNHNNLVVSELSVDGSTIDLTFRIDLDENREPSTDQFKVCPAENSSDSNCTATTDIEIDGKVVTLTFPANTLTSGATLWLRYSGTRLREKSGERREVGRIDAHRFQVPSAAAPIFVSGTADGSSVTLTFDSALNSSSTPPTSAFEVNDTAPSSVSVSGTQVTLTLANAVAEGVAVSVEYTGAGSPKLQGANGAAVAAFTSSVTNNTDTAPAPSSTSVNGAALSITFDQSLDTGSTPAVTDFSVSVGGMAATVSAVSLSGAVASLTLASAVSAADTVTVSYTQPATGGFRDSTPNRTASFGPLTATNRTAPVPSSATVDGNALTITFNANLDTTKTPLAAAFSITGHTVSAPTVQTNSIALTLSPSVKEGAAVAVSYDATQAGANPLQGATGGAVASFSSLSATNATDTAPVYVSGSVNGTAVRLTFDQALDTESIPPVVSQGRSLLSAFRVTVSGPRVGYSAISVSGSNVLITLLAPVVPADVVKVQYQLQTNSPIQDTSSPANQMLSFDPETLTNITPAQASAATVTGWTLAVTFTGSLGTDALPAKSAFSAVSGADSLTISSISASGSTLTLRLSAPVSRTAAVRVTYTPPQSNPLVDANSRAVAAFVLDATNNTPTAPTVSSATANGTAVTVAFARSLSSESTTAVSAFSVNNTAPTAAAVTNGQLALTVSPALREGATVSVAYTPSSTAKLIDQHGLAVAAFSTTATNNTDTAPIATTVTATARAVSVVFDQTLSTGSTPPKTAFSLGSGAPAVTGVSISGNTVTLALACCILPTDTLQLAYTPDSAKPLRDPTSNSVASFTISVTNRARQGPSVSSAAVAGDELRVTFNVNLDTTSKPATSAFTVTAASQTVSVSSVSISGKVVTLDLASSVAGDQTVKLAYQLPTTKPLSSSDGAVAAPFSNQAVVNRSPPLLTSATVNGSTLTLGFDTALNTQVAPDVADFTLTGATASSVAVSASSVALRLSATVAEGATVRIAYAPSSDPTKGIAGTNGIRLGSVAARDVNNTTDTTPVVSTATVNLAQIRITFDQALASAYLPAKTAFAVTPATAMVQSVAISGSTLTITLAQAVAEGASASVAYTPPTMNALRDATGNTVAQFSVALDNQTDTAPVLASSTVSGATLTLTFDQPLNATVKPALTQFTVTGTSVAAVAISGNTATLTLNSAVADGAAIEAQYTAPASGGFQDPTGNAVASFIAQPSNNTDNPPSTTAAVVAADGVTLRITFSESLSEAAADLPTAARFTLSGTTSSVNAVSVSSTTVTLTLNSSVREGETITLAYAATGTNLLRDVDQGRLAVAAFSVSVENQVDYAPSPTGASVNGATVAITFDQALKASAVPAVTAFSATVAGTAVTVTAAAISEARVSLTMARAATAAEAVTVSYTAPMSSGIQDTSSLAAVSFGPLMATNVTPPALQSAAANGAAVTLTFDIALDAMSIPPASAFTVTAATVSSVSVSGKTVSLSLAAAVHETTSLTLTYTPPSTSSQRLKGSNGAFVAALGGVTVSNQTDTAPIVAAASVNLNRATITFDQDLDTTSTPAAARFTLQGTTRTVTAVSVRNETLTNLGEATLTLSGNVREGSAITITYQPMTGAAGFLDPEGNAVAAFSTTAENITDTAPVATSGSVNGSAVRVVFDQPLDLQSVPAAAKFSLSGSTAQVTAVRLRNDTAARTGALELTLNAAVLEGATITLSYAAPTAGEISSQPGLKYLRDQQRNPAALSNFALTNLTDTAPIVASATVNGASLTVVFDQSLDASSVPPTSMFTVSGGRTVNSASISGAELRLVLAAAVADGDTLRISYTPGTGNRLRDATGNNVAAFAVDASNLTDTAPTVATAVTDVDGDTLTLTMSETVKLGTGTGMIKAAFTFEGSAAQVDSVTISGASVALALDPPAHELDQITLEYAPASGAARLLDADQGEMAVAAFQLSVTNNTDTAPVVKDISVDSDVLTIVFDQPLAGTHGPPYHNDIGQPLNSFRVRVGGALREFRPTTIDGVNVQVRLLQPVLLTDTVTVQYTRTTTMPLTDRSDSPNPVLSFDPQAVTNVTAAAPQSAAVDGMSLQVVFDSALSAMAPSKATLAVRVNDAAATVSSVAVSGSTLTLTLSAAVVEGASVTISYTPPAAMSGVAGLTDGRSRVVRAFSRAVDNNTDTTPVPLSATVDRGTMTIRFDQSVVGSPPATAFAVTEAGAARAVSRVQLSGDTVTLTLSAAVEEGTAIRVSYTKPTADELEDATGNAVANFALDARNTTALGPRPVRAESRLTELVVTFDKPLDPARLPSVSASAFSVSWAPDVIEVAAIDGTKLTLRLAAPGAGPDSRMRLRYVASADGLRGAGGHSVRSFAVGVIDRAEPPSVNRIIAIHDVVVVIFDGPLSGRHIQPRSWWFVASDRRHPVVTVDVNPGGLVALVLDEPGLPDGDHFVSLAYLPRHEGSGSLRGAAGHRVQSFHLPAFNATRLRPEAAQAVVNGSELTVQFSEPIQPSETQPDWFEVTTDHHPVRILEIEWEERSATLTLAQAVTTREFVTLRYTPRSDNGVHDRDALRLRAFTIGADNRTPLAETLSGRRQAAEQRARRAPKEHGESAARRELARELAYRGGAYATHNARERRWQRVAHESGSPAFTVSKLTLPRGTDEAQIEVRRVGYRALLGQVLGGPAALVWEPADDRPHVLSAWRVELSDRNGVPLAGRAKLSVELPLPTFNGPIALLVFDLISGSWRRVEYEAKDGVAHVDVVAPAVVALVGLPLREVALREGVTLVRFEGAEQLAPQAFAAAVDQSVIGIGVQDTPGRHWDYIAADEPTEQRPLRWGERVLIIRNIGAATITVALPLPLDDAAEPPGR